ncbi:638_t:CDS:2 [Paraglomus occultum]|uniref:638_t:CDS:1 n=1 Tax=Paraglomus occultum TaxID=144539 RepID=A0A9N9C2F8_9GLOM|nr:638_t:CDS:2 [Paraglomus occultum]
MVAFKLGSNNKLLTVLYVIFLVLIFNAYDGETSNVAYFEAFKPVGNNAKKVAIIGAGVGGASTAYYLSKAFANSSVHLQTTIYERSFHIGGRCRALEIPYGNRTYVVEVGASIFIDVNYHMTNASKEFGFKFRKPPADMRVGIWDGEQFVFEESKWYYVNVLKILWKYGLAPMRVKNMTRDKVRRFLSVYNYPSPFTDIRSLSHALGLGNEPQHTAEHYLKNLNNVYHLYLSHFVEPATRVNYGSNLDDIHALGGFISLAPEGAKGVEGGNYQVMVEFVNRSGATVKLGNAVKKVRKISDYGKTKYEVVGSDEKAEVFDAVVLAAPIQFTNIHFENIKVNHLPEIPYRTLHVTFVIGRLNWKYFKHSSYESLPEYILTTKTSTKFNSIGTSHILPDGNAIIKIFSEKELMDGDLDELFERWSWVYRKVWKAYPQLLPNQTYPPVEIEDGFYYVNSFEPLISAMETEAVSGNNIARLIHERWEKFDIKAKL